jgi:Glycosyl hydrolases family 31
MRSLVLMHQDDQTARETFDDCYFGPDFLVAPVVSDANQRSVYLPAGKWPDYWSGRRIRGRATLVADARLERAPIFVCAAAVIPKIPEDGMTLVQTQQLPQEDDCYRRGKHGNRLNGAPASLHNIAGKLGAATRRRTPYGYCARAYFWWILDRFNSEHISGPFGSRYQI